MLKNTHGVCRTLGRRGVGSWSRRLGLVTMVALVGAMAACSPAPESNGSRAPTADEIRVATRVQTERVLAAELDRITAYTDSVDQLFRPVAFLTPAQENTLRRFLSTQHLTRARALGIPRGADADSREAMLADGRLVELEGSTEYWIVRSLDRSSPLVVPAVRRMLVELGERFQRRLAELDSPAFRFEVSSVLRTAEDQAALRRSNPNAARGVSAHEYATTVDVAYNGFAAPMRAAVSADGPDAESADAVWLGPYLRQAEARLLERVAGRRSGELRAILGQVLREMQAEGWVLVTLERQQPVFHLTVARG